MQEAIGPVVRKGISVRKLELSARVRPERIETHSVRRILLSRPLHPPRIRRNVLFIVG